MALQPRPQIEAQNRRGKEALRSPFAALVAGSLLLPFASGCASSQSSERLKADVSTFNREHTTEKLVERAKGFAAVGDYTRAEEYLADALAQGADPRKVMPLLLGVCIKEQRYRLAAQYAREHLVKHPNDVQVRFLLGTLYAAIDEPKAARAELERVLEARPNDAQAHYALATLLRDADQDVVGADAHFREYLRLDPKGSHVEEARASVLRRVQEQP